MGESMFDESLYILMYINLLINKVIQNCINSLKNIN